MSRTVCAILILLALAPAAWACDCSSGGCHCSGTCACASASTPPPDQTPLVPVGDPGSNLTVNVAVANFSFTPADVTIHAGDFIEWDFVGGTHNAKSVVGSADPFDSGFFSSGSYSRQFLLPGTFNYYCVPHGFDNFDGTAGGMAGSITVLPVPEPAMIGLSSMAAAALILRRRRRWRML